MAVSEKCALVGYAVVGYAVVGWTNCGVALKDTWTKVITEEDDVWTCVDGDSPSTDSAWIKLYCGDS